MGNARDRTLLLLWTALLALVAVVLTFHMEQETDPFWHMTLGRAVLEHGSRVIPEPHSFLLLGQSVVVPEWLWGVGTYLVYQWLGETALTLLPMVFAALSVVALIGMLRRVEPAARLDVIILVSSLVILLVLGRIRLRPQAAFLALLPFFLYLVEGYVQAQANRARTLGVAIILTQLLWTQLHGSFVLGPGILGVYLVASLVRRAPMADRVRHGWVFLGCLLASLTNSYGIGIARYILSHSGGDAKQHVSDMLSPTWMTFHPLQNPSSAIYVLLLGFAVYAWWRLGKRVRPERVALLLLGIGLLTTAHRFFSAAAILAAPLALQGAQMILPVIRARWKVWTTITGIVCLAYFKTIFAYLDFFGPIGVAGFSLSAYPYAANAYLRELPKPVTVLSDYGAGEVLAFWQPGDIHTYVDARTPLHFNDTQFAVSRDIATSTSALNLLVDRYGLQTAVVLRNGQLCDALARSWTPVVIEPYYTTFVRAPGTPAITTVKPCGDQYVTPMLCAKQGQAFAQDMARLEKYLHPSFRHFLQAEHIVRCGGDLSAVPTLLPTRTESWFYRGQVDMLRAAWLSQSGHPEEAVTLLAPLLRRGNLDAFAVIEPSITSGRVNPEVVYGPLRDLVKEWDDQTPINVREALTFTCIRLGQADCVQFHGTRVALQGSRNARLIFEWLARNHREMTVRNEAKAWLEQLDRQQPRPPARKPRS